MAAVIQTGIVPILTAIQDQLVAKVPLALNMVKWTSHREPVPHFDADHDVVLRVGSFIPKFGEYSATTAQVVRRYLTVYPRTRLSLDPKDRDTQWLLNTALGHLSWEEKVMRALYGYFPNDAHDSTIGNLLADQELQMSAGTDPVKGEIDISWGDSAITFEIEYLFSLMQPYVTG